MLAKGEAADLSYIVRHTNEEWAEARCRAFVRRLENEAVAVGRGSGVLSNARVGDR